jgi:hypothetical protein
MATISKVYYEEIDPSQMNIREAGAFYYYTNLVTADDEAFQEAYETYEMGQLYFKNRLIASAKLNGKLEGIPNINRSLLAISSIKERVILLVDLR